MRPADAAAERQRLLSDDDEGRAWLHDAPPQPPTDRHGAPPRRRVCRPAYLFVVVAALAMAALLSLDPSISPVRRLADLSDATYDWLDHVLRDGMDDEVARAHRDVCPQQPAYQPPPPSQQPGVLLPPVHDLAHWLSGAVQIDTSVGDNWPSPRDDPERWRKFDELREYLRLTFPRLHTYGAVRLEAVNRHALLYTWPGSDASLKPLLLTSHQDVVPVEADTAGAWRYPPFSGHVDANGTLWGRGAADTKSTLVSILASLEALQERALGFRPRRTVLFAVGFDEEAGGLHGAASLARVLEQRYPAGVSMLVDEGNGNLASTDGLGMPVALVGVAEKGSAHVTVRVEKPGGHSSLPPRHTSIGVLSWIVAELERRPVRPREGHLPEAHIEMLLCVRDAPALRGTPLARSLADYDWARRSARERGTQVGASLRRQLHTWPAAAVWALLDSPDRRRRRLRLAERRVVAHLPYNLYMPLTTTQAADIVRGGTKINALPETASVSVDHRIATWDSIDEVRRRWTDLLSRAAAAFNLELTAFGQGVPPDAIFKFGPPPPPEGKLSVEMWDGALRVAPPTPLEGEGGRAWRLLQSVIRHAYRTNATMKEPTRDAQRGMDAPPRGGRGVRVVPSLMQGNTDTRHYWNLTHNIFRYTPTALRDSSGIGTFTGIHSVDEHYTTAALRQNVDFYTTLILAADADGGL